MSILTKGVGKYLIISGASYTGPGDTVSNAYAWWGLRGYSAAYSTGSNPAIDVVDTATGLLGPTVVNIKSDGSLDTATILGLGYAVSVTKLYDQTNNGYHLIQTTLANMPSLTLSGIGGLPVMTFTGGSQGLKSTTSQTAQAQPIVAVTYVKRTGDFTTQADILQASQGGIQCLFASSANTAGSYSGTSVPTVSVTDSHWHSLIYLFNGTSSDIFVDGSSNAPLGSNPGTNGILSGTGIGKPFLMGDDSTGGGNPLKATITEGGWWPSDISASVSALRTNQQNYWGGT